MKRVLGLLVVTLVGLLFLLPGAVAAADAAVNEANWPHWRGPLGTGVAPEADPPVAWSRTENVRWSYDDPGVGFSSPIVWKNRVILTTAVAVDGPDAPAEEEQRGIFGLDHPTRARRFTVIVLDRETGEEVWQQVATERVPHEGHHKTLSSFANISPVTDGERIFASFGSFGLYAYDFEGTLLWQRDFEVAMKVFNRFGESSSPALWGDTLVLSFDHLGQSFIVAIDKRTGETLWRVDREEDTTWTSPYAFEHDGAAQVVVSGGNFVRSYALADGELLWQVSGMTRGPIPTPVYGDGMLYVASGTNGQAFKAIRLGARGDLTGTEAEVWSLDKGTPYNPSPLLWGEELYLLKDVISGSTFVSAFAAKTGEPYYFNARLPQSWTIKASPVGAADRIYLSSEEGDVVVLRRGPELEVLAVNSLDEQILATPALAGRDLFVRTREGLYRISEEVR